MCCYALSYILYWHIDSLPCLAFLLSLNDSSTFDPQQSPTYFVCVTSGFKPTLSCQSTYLQNKTVSEARRIVTLKVTLYLYLNPCKKLTFQISIFRIIKLYKRQTLTLKLIVIFTKIFVPKQ